MKPTNAKPHAGRRGASDHASARESVSGWDDTASAASVSQLPAGEFSGAQPALIPPGLYVLRMTHWRTAILWGRSPKLGLHFRVCDFGPHFDVELVRWYNVDKITGRPSLRGRFKIGWRNDLVRDYCALVSDLKRLDRIYLDRLESLLIRARVETVTVNSRQKALPEPLHYSVVRELLGVEAGGREPCLASPRPRPVPTPTP